MAEVRTVSQFISNLVSRQAEKAYNAGATMDLMDIRSELGSLESHYRHDPVDFARLYDMPSGLEDNITCRP